MDANHTPEPWAAEFCERHHSHDSLTCFRLRDATGRAIEGPANLRRIVACVNFCAGASPETLASFSLDDLVSGAELTALRASHERLAEACQAALQYPLPAKIEQQALDALDAMPPA